MSGEEPPYLTVGTDVSAKYKGAFCEAKIKRVWRSVKCKLTFKNNVGPAIVTDDFVKGTLRVGAHVEAKHPERNQYLEAVINKLHDCSQYTVVFDDGDETTLRRTSLCLKSGRHFAESETLDQLPLTHPEHFGTPVMGMKGRKRRTLNRSAMTGDSSDEEVPTVSKKKVRKPKEVDADMGKVVCVEVADRKKQKDNWFPAVIVSPGAHQIRVRTKDENLVRSFKDGKYHVIIKKETKEFTKEIGSKVENNTLRTAVDKALLYLEKDELPPHWDKELLFGANSTSNDENSDQDSDSETSDDEPSEEKDRFVAQLYKFMDDRGTPINKAPAVSNKDLNLYKLFKVVQKMSGYNRVTNQMQWKAVYVKMGLPAYSSTSSHQIKQAYKKYLHSFEDFYRKLGCTMGTSTRSGRVRNISGRSMLVTRELDREFKAAGRRLHKHADKVVKEADPKKSKEVEAKTEKDPEEEVKDSKKPADAVKPSKKVGEPEVSPANDGPTKSKSARESVVVKQESKVVKQEEKKCIVPDSSEEEEDEEDGDDEKEEGRSRSRARGEGPGVRRGRKKGLKKKGGEEGGKSNESGSEKTSHEIRIVVGDRVKVKYGRSRQEKIYEAKVLKLDEEDGGCIYFVHYTGWNMRYDEWVKKHRIVENLTRRTISKRTRTSMTLKGGKGPLRRGRPHGKNQGVGPPPGHQRLQMSRGRTTRSDRNSLADSPFANGLEPRRRTRRSSGPGGPGDSSSDEDEDDGESESGADSDDQDDDERGRPCDSPPADKLADDDLNTSLEDGGKEDEESSADDESKLTNAAKGARVATPPEAKGEKKPARAERLPPSKSGRNLPAKAEPTRAVTPKSETGRAATPKSDAGTKASPKLDPVLTQTTKTEAGKDADPVKGSRAKLTRSISKEFTKGEDEDGEGSKDCPRQGSPRTPKTRGRPVAKPSPARSREEKTKAKVQDKKSKMAKKTASDSDEEAESDGGNDWHNELSPKVMASSKKEMPVGDDARVKTAPSRPSLSREPSTDGMASQPSRIRQASASEKPTDVKIVADSGGRQKRDRRSTGKLNEPVTEPTPRKAAAVLPMGDETKRKSEPFSNLEKAVGIEVRVDTVAHTGMAEEDDEEPMLSSFAGLSRVGRGAKGKGSPARTDGKSTELMGSKLDRVGRDTQAGGVSTSILDMDDEMKRISSNLHSSIMSSMGKSDVESGQQAGVLDNNAIFGTAVDEVEAFAADYCPIMDSSCDTIEMDNIFPPGLMESVKAVATPEGDGDVARFMHGGRDSPCLAEGPSKLSERDIKLAEMAAPVVVSVGVSLRCEGGDAPIPTATQVMELEKAKDDLNSCAAKPDTNKEDDNIGPELLQESLILKSEDKPKSTEEEHVTSEPNTESPKPVIVDFESKLTEKPKLALDEPKCALVESNFGKDDPKRGKVDTRDQGDLTETRQIGDDCRLGKAETKNSPSDEPSSKKADTKLVKDDSNIKTVETKPVDDYSFMKAEMKLSRDNAGLKKVDATLFWDDSSPKKEDAKHLKEDFKLKKVEIKLGKDDFGHKLESKLAVNEDSGLGLVENRLGQEDFIANKSQPSLVQVDSKIGKEQPIIELESKLEVAGPKAGQAVSKTVKSASSLLKEHPVIEKVKCAIVEKDEVKSSKESGTVETEDLQKLESTPNKDKSKFGNDESSYGVAKCIYEADQSKITKEKPNTGRETIVPKVATSGERKAVVEESTPTKEFPEDASEVAKESTKAPKVEVDMFEGDEVDDEADVDLESIVAVIKGGKKERRKQRSRKLEKRKSATTVVDAESSDENGGATPEEPKSKKKKNRDEREGKGKQRSRDRRSRSKKTDGADSSKKRKGRRRDCKRRRGESASHRSLADRTDGGDSDADASTASSEGGLTARKQKERRSRKRKQSEQERRRSGKKSGGKLGRSEEQLLQSTGSDESGGHVELKRGSREKGGKSRKKREKERKEAAMVAKKEATSSDDSVQRASPFKHGSTDMGKASSSVVQSQHQQDAWKTFVGASKEEKLETKTDPGKVTLEDPPKERRDISSYLICEENVPASPMASDGAGVVGPDDDIGNPEEGSAMVCSGIVNFAKRLASESQVAPLPFVPLTMRHKMEGAESSSVPVLDNNTPPTTPERPAGMLPSSEVSPNQRDRDGLPFYMPLVQSGNEPTDAVDGPRLVGVTTTEHRMDHMQRVQCLLDQCSQGDRDLLDLAGLETRRGRGGSSGEGLLEGLAAVAGAKREQAATAASLENDAATTSRRRRRNPRKHHHQLPAGCDSSHRHSGSSSYGRHRHNSGKNFKDSDTEDPLPTAYHPVVSSSSLSSHSATTMSRGILEQHVLQQQSPRPSRFNFYVELDDYSDGAERIAILQEKLTELRKTYLALKAEVACIDRRRKKLKRKEKEAASSNGSNLSSAVLECS